MEELKIGIEVKANTAGARQAEDSLNRVGVAAQKASGEMRGLGNGGGAVAASMNKTAQAAAQATGSLQGMGQSAQATGNVITGLERASQGGIEGLRGLGQAAKGVGQLIQTGFGGVLGVLSLVAAGIGLVQAALNKWVATAGKDLSDAYKKAAEDSNKWKAAQLEQAKVADESLKKQIADVQKLSSEFERVIALMDKAAGRNDALDDAERELALSKATTDEERAAINDRFDAAAIDTKGLRAGLKKSAAQETQREAQAKLDAATVAVGTAKNGSEREAAEKKLAEVRAETAKVFEQTDEVIKNAELEERIAPKKKKALENRVAERTGPKITAIIDPSQAKIEDTSKLQKEIESAKAERDAIDDADRKSFTFKLGGPDASKLVARKDQEIAAMREMLTATEARNSEAVAAFKRGAKNEKKTTEQIKNARAGS